MTARLLVLLAALVSGSCALHGAPLTAPRLCVADGLPPKLILGPSCVRGVCGYTCAPDRWAPPPAPAGGS